MTRLGGWIQTYSGNQFWPLDAKPGDIEIEDIAHALSNACRFAGHCKSFYSVAQHSVLVSQVCKPEDALWGLLHDAAEAYLGDMTRPIKHTPAMSYFRTAERRLMESVCDRFGLARAEPDSVQWADATLLRTERRDLLHPLPVTDEDWSHGSLIENPLSSIVVPWDPASAKGAFLARYDELALKPAPFTGTPYEALEDGGW